MKVLLFLGLFVAAVGIELGVRASFGGRSEVDCSRVEGVEVSLWRQPDFLWVGEAWSVKVDSSVPFELELGACGTAVVPAGSYLIYANHDGTNLDEYGYEKTGEVPDPIKVRPAAP